MADRPTLEVKEDVATFDAPFFRITAQEAHAMDPSQRLALELSYEAMENGAPSHQHSEHSQELTLGSWHPNGIDGWLPNGLLHGDVPARLRQPTGYRPARIPVSLLQDDEVIIRALLTIPDPKPL